jgi:hypothetical protein
VVGLIISIAINHILNLGFFAFVPCNSQRGGFAINKLIAMDLFLSMSNSRSRIKPYWCHFSWVVAFPRQQVVKWVCMIGSHIFGVTMCHWACCWLDCWSYILFSCTVCSQRCGRFVHNFSLIIIWDLECIKKALVHAHLRSLAVSQLHDDIVSLVATLCFKISQNVCFLCRPDSGISTTF